MKNRFGGRRPIRRGTFVVMGALLASGCGKDKMTDHAVGEVHLALTLPNGTSINSVDWEVLSSSNSVVEMGTLNTTGARTPSFILEFAHGYGLHRFHDGNDVDEHHVRRQQLAVQRRRR